MELSCHLRASASDITRVLESSSNLVDWLPVMGKATSSHLIAPGIERVNVDLDQENSGYLFFRWGVRLRNDR
jgi:hypothetical protein